MSTNLVVLTTDDESPREPDARCDRCGAVGTVVRMTRRSTPPLVRRYCAACWPEARRAHEAAEDARREAELARWRDDPTWTPAPAPGWGWSSRVWSDVQEFLAMIAQVPQGGPGPTAADLTAIAQEIAAGAPDMEGAMPADVAAFVRRHAGPTPGAA